jgi:spore maturation protein CgeB
MRLYEATGVGSLLLTNEGSNLTELFQPGSEVVTYADVDDLVEKARHYLAHEDERRTIAAAGQARTLRDHTYEVRMRELAEILGRHTP